MSDVELVGAPVVGAPSGLATRSLFPNQRGAHDWRSPTEAAGEDGGLAYTAEPAPVQGETTVMTWERFTEYLLCRKEKTWLRTAYYMKDMKDVKALVADAEEADIDITSASTWVPRGRAD